MNVQITKHMIGARLLDNLWNKAEKRQMQLLLDVGLGADAVVEVLETESDAEASYQAEQDREQQRHLNVGLHGNFGFPSWIEHPDVARPQQARQLDVLEAL